MQGWRIDMEDAHIATKIYFNDRTDGLLFAVFDGHGGDKVAKFAKQNF